MNKRNKNKLIWTFGFSETLELTVRELLGKKFLFRNWPCGNIPSLADYEKDMPHVSILSSAGLEFLSSCAAQRTRHLDYVPRIVLLENNCTQKEIERALDAGAGQIILPPYTAKKLSGKIRQIRDSYEIQENILHMIREIGMEREILERKNNIMDFLVNFLTGTSASREIESILQSAFSAFGILFPIRGLQAALWEAGDPSGNLDIYLSVPVSDTGFSSLVESILNTFRELRPRINPCPRIRLYAQKQGRGQDGAAEACPATDNPLTLPLTLHGGQCGFLLLSVENFPSLGRDQALALNSALHHLAVTLEHARNFKRLIQFSAESAEFADRSLEN
ncbi:MAG: hypothetical protein LBQ63_08330 [Deltaproteobacteria bacterium]|nr:hypothetical protein [Deltaproteobacteria bacterium]